ncbi:MAG: class I SAM-dependent RNA methyltransferase [Cyclobacteriaceae bacterium]|nr:class I SAM-dependent RNA methyltransferase [Cyclobacteriaceae bacterium]
MKKEANIFVICAPEISPILHEEIKALGFTNTKEHRLGVQLYGTLADCMYLNLQLRTANKVLWEVSKFYAANPDQLYNKAIKIAWEEEIDVDGYFNIDSFVKNDTITDSRFANLKLKDAIVDRFMERNNKRPDTGPDKDLIRIYMHWVETECILYYDTSGGVIAKHGYRKIPGTAPMLESLAAAVIMASKWDKKSTFINPMCGSGTLAIEAALLATNTAPGLFRDNFGFMHLASFDKSTWDDMCDRAQAQIKPCEAKIYASDISEDAIKNAQFNTEEARMNKHIEYSKTDFRQIDIPEEPGIVILNPEYGERLGEEDELIDVYKEIGDLFKQKCQGYTGYVFTGNRELGKNIGLRTKRKIPFYNGSIECRLLEYELYRGTKKEK